MMGAKSHADESSGPAEPSLPHQQAVDMTAPETFTTAPRQPLTKGRRPDMAAICAKQTYAMKTENFRFGSNYPFAEPPGNARSLRIAVVHCVAVTGGFDLRAARRCRPASGFTSL